MISSSYIKIWCAASFSRLWEFPHKTYELIDRAERALKGMSNVICSKATFHGNPGDEPDIRFAVDIEPLGMQVQVYRDAVSIGSLEEPMEDQDFFFDCAPSIIEELGDQIWHEQCMSAAIELIWSAAIEAETAEILLSHLGQASRALIDESILDSQAQYGYSTSIRYPGSQPGEYTQIRQRLLRVEEGDEWRYILSYRVFAGYAGDYKLESLFQRAREQFESQREHIEQQIKSLAGFSAKS